MSEFNTRVAVEQFVKRYVENESKKRVNNSDLHAGSPMYYYCRFCRVHTETLPETHYRAPKTICDPCKALKDHGLIEDARTAGKAAVAREQQGETPPDGGSAWDRIGGDP